AEVMICRSVYSLSRHTCRTRKSCAPRSGSTASARLHYPGTEGVYVRSRAEIRMERSNWPRMRVTMLSEMDENEAVVLADRLLTSPLEVLLGEARDLSRTGHGDRVSYSRKVFIPLTRLCRDVCAYCTFAASPKQVGSAYLSPDEVLAIARAGQAAGCKEALFTLGDKPELRYKAARDALAELGYSST